MKARCGVLYNLKKSRRFKAPKMKALKTASKRPKTPESTLKRLKALLSFPGHIWSRLPPQCTYLAKCFNLSLQLHFSKSNIEPSFVKPTNVIFGAHYLHQSSFNFKIASILPDTCTFRFCRWYCVTHATSFENSSCIAESILATGKWSFFVTLLHEGYLYVICHWLKNWRPFVCEIFDILKSLLLKRTLTIAHECGAEIASQEWYFQGSSFKKEVCGTFQLDLNVISNNVEISSQQFF